MSTWILFLILLICCPAVFAEEWRPFPESKGSLQIYEPSGIIQLEDGRLLLVQDESNDPLVLLDLDKQGACRPIRPKLDTALQPLGTFGKDGKPEGLEDLEGLAQGPDNYLYAITSHSRTLSGKRRQSREKLVRFRINDKIITEFDIFKKLHRAILESFPLFKKFDKNNTPKGRKGFNIEGLCFDKTGQRLLLGMRAPVIGGDSFILIIENPADLFSENAAAKFAPNPVKLRLNKGGIRGMSYISGLDGYLLLSQKSKNTKNSTAPFELWFWHGIDEEPAQSLNLAGIGLRNSEGITQVSYLGQDFLMIVSDEGSRKSDRPGQYLLIPLEKIRNLLK